jgi:hypothetical protein
MVVPSLAMDAILTIQSHYPELMEFSIFITVAGVQ